ncbi:Glycosyl hydrolases family 16 [Frankineae bacterium MT45]|nr:Glycosyl hydrolases family 16 [Frankineae bacterium MT45]
MSAVTLDRSMFSSGYYTGANRDNLPNLGNPEAQSYLPGQVGENGAGSAFSLTAQAQPNVNPDNGVTYPWASGALNSHDQFNFKYGTVEARVHTPIGHGLWSAFWTVGADGNWPYSGEIDIVETDGWPDKSSCNTHTAAKPGGSQYVGALDMTISRGWKLDWQPTYIAVYQRVLDTDPWTLFKKITDPNLLVHDYQEIVINLAIEADAVKVAPVVTSGVLWVTHPVVTSTDYVLNGVHHTQ